MGRKYNALAIVSYILNGLMVVTLAIMQYALLDTSSSDEELAGIAVALVLILFIAVGGICAIVGLIATVIAIIGWCLTAKSCGKGAVRYKILTFVPLAVLVLSAAVAAVITLTSGYVA